MSWVKRTLRALGLLASSSSEEAPTVERPVQRSPTPATKVQHAPQSAILGHESLAPAGTPSIHRRRQAVVIGFDYGTHSTKILVQRRGADRAETLCLEPPVRGYPWFASPSLVLEAEGCLFFGGAALARRVGTLHRSLKVQLLAPGGVHAVQAKEPVDAELLVTAYLSWAFGRVAQALEDEYGLLNLRVFLNVAAPMNHMEDLDLKARYLRVVQAAWRSSFGESPDPVQDGASLESVRSRFLSELDPTMDVEPESERPFAVLPETIAPIVSLSRSPKMAPGYYLLMDMGAGTTEVSICHVNRKDADQRVLCYKDHSEVIGGDDFARADGMAEGADQEIDALVDRVHKLVWKTWGLGYQKDAPRPSLRKTWKTLRLILSGGGSRREAILRALQAHRMAYFQAGEVDYSFDWHEPEDIHGVPPDGARWGDDGRLLAVAHGLSIHRQEWPVQYEPGDVAELARAEEIEHLPADWYNQ